MSPVDALCRAGYPLNGLDANDRRDDRILEAVIRFAEIILHRLGIEATGDLLRGSNRELAASNFDEAPALKFFLEQLTLGLGALLDGVGMSERVGKCRVSKVVKAGWGYGREFISLGHGVTPLAWVRAGAEVTASPRLANLIYVKYAEVN